MTIPVPPISFPRIDPVTEAILFFGIPGAPDVPTEREPEDAALLSVLANRLSTLAVDATKATPLQISPADMERLQVGRRSEAAVSLRMDAWAPKLQAELTSHGVASLVIKGPAMADAYGVRAWRSYRDIDLLVSPNDFVRARAVLGERGFSTPDALEPARKYFDRSCMEATTLARADGVVIDLHHHITPWIWGRRLSLQTLLTTSRRLEIATGTLTVPAIEDLLLIASLHVICDRSRPEHDLLIWRDIATLATAVDPQRAASRASAAGLSWVLRSVFAALPPYARPRELQERLDDARPSWSDRVRLRGIIPRSGVGAHMAARAFRLPLPNAAAYVAGYLVPSRAFLRIRYGRPRAYAAWWRDSTGRYRSDLARPRPNTR